MASCEAVSFAIAFSRQSTDPLDRVDSTIDAQWKHHCYTWYWRPKKPPESEREGRNVTYFIHASTVDLHGIYRGLEASRCLLIELTETEQLTKALIEKIPFPNLTL